MPNPSLQQHQQLQQQPRLTLPQTVLATQVPTLTSLPQPVMNGSTPASQQLVINPGPAGTVGTQPSVLQSASPVQPQPNNENNADSSSQQQEKANKIIAEAIAKAQKSGNAVIPRILQPPELPATLGDLDNPEQLATDKKPKKKRKYTPRKERGEKGDKLSKPKKKKSSNAGDVSSSIVDTIKSVASDTNVDVESLTDEIKIEDIEPKEEKPRKKKEKGEKKHSEKTPKRDRKRLKK